MTMSRCDQKLDAGKKLLQIEMSINCRNTTDTYKFVSTHDAVLKIDNKVSNNYRNKKPISILVLKPGEELSMRAEANIGISKVHAAYEATTNVYFIEHSTMKYDFFYETLGQLSCDMIFTKSCTILIKKLETLVVFIKNKFPTEPETAELVEIELYGEEHTLGNLLATALQKCDKIREAGYRMPHPFTDMVVIRFRLAAKTKSGPISVFNEVVAYLIRVFEYIRDKAFS